MVKNNLDLQGRIMNITMKPWKNEELEEISKKGFEMLEVIDRVFDWKENMLTFREPLFLFYLRWRRDE